MNDKITINKSEVIIILPAYNEEKVIYKVLENLRKEGYSNICVIDDGSSDKTKEEVVKLNVQLIQHPINRGAGAAIQTGITFAKIKGFKYAVLMDSDGQHLPSDIKQLYLKMQNSNADIVVGNRFSLVENNIPKHRIFYNWIANVLTNILCRKNYNDTQSGFRLLNRKAIEMIQLSNRGFGFCSEMLIFATKANLLVEETPIKVIYTSYSLNKGQNLIEGIRTAKSILWQVIFE